MREQQPAMALGYTQTVTNANYILQRVNGTWAAMGTGAAGGQVQAIAYNPVDGCTYVGGGFTSMNSVAGTAYIAKWTPGATAGTGTWSALSSWLR